VTVRSCTTDCARRSRAAGPSPRNGNSLNLTRDSSTVDRPQGDADLHTVNARRSAAGPFPQGALANEERRLIGGLV
jgi:hypothetical protein